MTAPKPADAAPTRLLILADTHLPRRAKDLPAQLWAEVDRADLVIHADDWTSVQLLDALDARSRRLIGVCGNNDGADLRARLPGLARATVGGVRLAVVHETGSAPGRHDRMARQFPNTDVLVFGHSHIPWDSTAPGGLRLLNPGSPTDRRRQPVGTYLTAVLGGGELSAVTLHPVGPAAGAAPG